MAMISFGQQNIQIWLFVFDLYVCLFVSYKSISQKRTICISTFFFRKRKYQFLPSHIEFYLAICNLRLLLILGFGPVGGGGGGRGVYPGAAGGRGLVHRYALGQK